jgi:hypothetical protein
MASTGRTPPRRLHRHDKEIVMLQRIEMDEHVALGDQLAEEVGPVTLINTFKVAPEDADTLLEAWAADAAYLKTKPGFISTSSTAVSPAAGCS